MGIYSWIKRTSDVSQIEPLGFSFSHEKHYSKVQTKQIRVQIYIRINSFNTNCEILAHWVKVLPLWDRDHVLSSSILPINMLSWIHLLVSWNTILPNNKIYVCSSSVRTQWTAGSLPLTPRGLGRRAGGPPITSGSTQVVCVKYVEMWPTLTFPLYHPGRFYDRISHIGAVSASYEIGWKDVVLAIGEPHR